jgi:GNAT superfamily N-acetyltransferase
VIRPAALADLDAIFTLVEQFTTSYQAERDGFEIAVLHLMADDDVRLVVAEVGGEVIGYALGFSRFALYASGRIGWLEEIMVREDMRRAGIGRVLLADIEAWAQSRGCKQIALATRRAAFFYLALGYEDSATYFKKRL